MMILKNKSLSLAALFVILLAFVVRAAGCSVRSPAGLAVDGPQAAWTELPEVQVFKSPDGAKRWIKAAHIWAEVLNWAGESAVCLRTEGCQYFKESFFSPDGGHGWVVSRLAWSPDGRFLAYQLSSSGGHQPYWAPVRVQDLSTGKLVDMDVVAKGLFGSSWFAVSEDPGDIYWSPDGRLHFHVWSAGVRNELTAHELSYEPEREEIKHVSVP